MKSIAILQSNYVPWKGYFDLIQSVDEFVILDSVQYTKNDWRNRNRIRTPRGPAWLTIPVQTSGRFGQAIDQAKIADLGWARKHFRSLVDSYGNSCGFARRADELEISFQRAAGEVSLSAVNEIFLRLICRWMRIETPIASSRSYPDHPDRNERLVGICRAAGADRYVSGPRASAYLDRARFEQAGIQVEYFRYDEVPEPRLSALDQVLA